MKNRSIAFSLLILAAGACNAFTGTAGGRDPFARYEVVVQADNQGSQDMNVYAVRLTPNSGSATSPGGVYRVRVGTVHGNSKRDLTVPSSVLSDCSGAGCFNITALRLLAVPAGTFRPSVDQEATVVLGDTVVLVIADQRDR